MGRHLSRLAREDGSRGIGRCDAAAGPSGSERGAGTVLAVGAIAVVAAFAVSLLVLLKGASAMQRAQTAADMLALVTARRMFDDGGDPCPSREEVRRYEVVLESCRIEGDRARIDVSAYVPEVGLTVRASALAGPADSSVTGSGSSP